MKSGEPHVIFELAGSHYGVRSSEVMHIDLVDQITPVPNTGLAVEGIIFTRGEVVPVLNLRTRFGLPAIEHTARSRLIVARLHSRTVGLLVDAAREFRALASESIKPIQPNLHGVNGNFLRGTTNSGDRLILLIDLEAVLSPEEIPQPAAETKR